MPTNCISRTVLAVIVSCSIVFSYSAALSQDTADSAALTARFEREFAQSAVVNRWREDRDFVTPILMLKAAAMSKAGFDRDEIVTEISTRRAEWEAQQGTGLRADWQVDEDYRILIRHGGALAGLAAGSRAGVDLSAVGEAVADVGILTYEQFARDGEVQEASRQLGLQYDTVRRSEDQIAGFVTDVYSESELFKEIYEEQFASTIGFRPTDGMDAISESYPEFASQEGVRTLVDILTRNDGNSATVALTDAEREQLKSYMEESLSDLREDNAERISSLAAQNAQGVNLIQELAISDARRRELERQRAEERVVFEGRRAGAFLATTALGLIDPELGRQAEGVVNAAIEVNRAIEAFDAASKLGEEFAGSASMALTGNFVGAALSLVGVFASSGPSPEELILQEIAKLRQDIANLRMEMHERFDAVDARLDAIYERLDNGLRDLEQQLQRTTNRSLLAIRDSLVGIEARQATATALLLNRTDLILAHMSAASLAPCLDIRSKTTLQKDEDWFGDCVVMLGRQVQPALLYSEQTPVDPNSDPATFAQLLRERPNEVANLSHEIFSTGSGLQNPQPIAGPLDWAFSAEAYLGFIDEWPEYRSVITDFEYERVRIEGEKLFNAVRDMQSSLIAYSSGAPSPALEGLIGSLEGTGTILADLIGRYESEFYSRVLERPPLNLLDEGEEMQVRALSMSPDMRDREWENCPFHILNGSLPAPDRAYAVLPAIVQRAVDLGIGELRYCMSTGYAQPTEEYNIGTPQYPDIGIRPTGPGPYTARLQIQFVWGELNCWPNANPPIRHAVVYDVSVSDPSRMAGAWGTRAPVPDHAIWNDDWRSRFLGAVNSGGGNVSSRDRWAQSRQCVETALTPVVYKKLNELRARLSADMYQQFDTDTLISAGEDQIRATSALLSHWIWMGYSDKLQRSDILASLASGATRPPTLRDAIEIAQSEGKYAWEAVDIYRHELTGFLQILKSPSVARALAEPGDSFGIQAILARAPSS